MAADDLAERLRVARDVRGDELGVGARVRDARAGHGTGVPVTAISATATRKAPSVVGSCVNQTVR
ncbi:hypothetical protein GCM10009528_23650 [Kineococcus aurantiacus]